MAFKIVLKKFNNTKETIKCKNEIIKNIYVSDAKNNWRSKKIATIEVNGKEIWRCPKNFKK